MQKLNPRQLMKLLLNLSGLKSTQAANKINKSKATWERWSRNNDICIRQLNKLSIALEIPIQLELGKSKHPINLFRKYIFQLHELKGVTIEGAAEKIGIPTSTLKARIYRNSCKLGHVSEHFEALDEELILTINHNKYQIA